MFVKFKAQLGIVRRVIAAAFGGMITSDNKEFITSDNKYIVPASEV